MLGSSSSRVLLAVAALATASSATSLDERQIFICLNGEATCCQGAFDPTLPDLQGIIEAIPIIGSIPGLDAIIVGLLDGLTGGASTLVGQVGVVCGLDSLTGCNGEIPLCCTNTDFVDNLIATGCSAPPISI